MDLSRRALLKLLGITAAGNALRARSPPARALSPAGRGDVPGVANWYATVCSECDAGCGMQDPQDVRVHDGLTALFIVLNDHLPPVGVLRDALQETGARDILQR
jgi:anaerobic selenocysteine-containing dehydrogenase